MNVTIIGSKSSFGEPIFNLFALLCSKKGMNLFQIVL